MTAQDDGAVRITLRDIFDKVEATERNVSLLVLGFDAAQKTSADHEARLRAVEKRVWAIPSAAILLAAASLVVALLSLHAGERPSTPTNLGAPSSTPTTVAPRPVAQKPVSVVEHSKAQTIARARRTHETSVQAPVTPVSTHPPASPIVAPVAPVAKPVIDLVSRLSTILSGRAPPVVMLSVPAVPALPILTRARS